jgi:hypothetical protein
MNHRLFLSLMLAVGASVGTVSAASRKPDPAQGAVFNFLLVTDRPELRLDYKGLPLLVYAFDTNQFKPYVRELYTFHGVNVLRDAPADHLHHHGLMYAIKVNGTNFWEETPVAGHQRPGRDLLRTVGRDPDGRPRAKISQPVYWLTPDQVTSANPAAVALLVEQRTLTVTVDERTGEVALEWRGDFKVGPTSPKVTLGGAAYHGLGLRLPEAFDKVARHQNSDEVPYTAEQKWDVTPAKWASVSGTVGSKDVMVGLFSHPANRNAPKFFSMIDTFAYLSATQGLDVTPVEYAAGDTFSVRYLLTVYPSRKSKEFLSQRYARWSTD